MVKIGKTRRAIGLTAATLALAGGTAIGTAGSAHAAGMQTTCTPYQSAGNGAWEWSLQTCIDEESPWGMVAGSYYVHAPAGATDVRVIYDLHMWCPDTDIQSGNTHWYSPADQWVASDWHPSPVGCYWTMHTQVFESGQLDLDQVASLTTI
jgi:hypothetical protein